MSYPLFKRILFSHDSRAREKMLQYFTIWMKKQSVAPIKIQQIPKQIRGEVWKKYNGNSIIGSCYCCKKTVDVFDIWNAGHVRPHSQGGVSTVDNLRPVCVSCNMSMGTQNMYVYKSKYYPEK